jgi:ankyrin repeat protein
VRGSHWTLLTNIAVRDEAAALRHLRDDPDLATRASLVGATRGSSRSFFLDDIKRYVVRGDTALHIAAAAHSTKLARALVARGASLHARNRYGATPLHSAAVGAPNSISWKPRAQAAVISYLIGAGADPNATDKRGVAPLHVAVRTRGAAAVRALLAHGADRHRRNGNGSAPLDLARRTTGKGGSGTAAARAQQAEIIQLLLHGVDS